MYPNEEFRARLDRGRQLFNQSENARCHVEIYVSGSRHVFEGRPDHVSLSEAGRSYLTSIGISPRVVHDDDLNRRYKGPEGV